MRLEEALGVLRAELEVYTREAMLADWATTQYHLADVLKTLGERASNMSRLQEARSGVVNCDTTHAKVVVSV